MQAKIVTEWSDIIGAELAAQSRFQRLKNGVVIIHADRGAALEIQHLAPKIIDRINGLCGYRAVARLKIIQRS